MSLFSQISAGLRNLFFGQSVEREIDDELRSFVDESAAHKRSLGSTEAEAARAARIEMGSTNAVAHRIRSAGWETTLENFMRDLRHSIRALLRTPGFTLVALLSLALGIGANTAIFTLIRQILLSDLPVREPGQLVSFGPATGSGVLGGVDLGLFDQYTYDFARHLELNPGPFSGVASYSSISPMVSVRVPNASGAIQVSGSLVSGNYFSVLGAAPMLGRVIVPADAQAEGANAVVVVSYHFWQQSLSSDPGVIGQTIRINATPFTVVGVMAQDFHGIRRDLSPPDLWSPLTMIEAFTLEPGMLAPRSLYFIHMFARLAPGASLASNQQWLDRQMHDYVRAGEGNAISADRQHEIDRIANPLTPAAHGTSSLGNQYGPSLKILMVVVALVLLIACANLANFLLARTLSRERETATRLALGSTRARVVRLSLLESLMLALAGGVAGLAVAFAATRALIALVASDQAYTSLSAWPDTSVLLFTLGVSLAAGVLFGLAPALRSAHTSAGPALGAGARTHSSAGSHSRGLLPRALVAGQIVLSLLLLVGAGLFLRTLVNLQNQNYGFEQTQLVLADFDPHLGGYTPDRGPSLNQQLIERIQAAPGIRSAALANTPPISFGSWRSSISLSGYTPAPKEEMISVLNRVSGRYFDTTGIALVAGRAITPSDNATAQKVCVINQTIARKFYPKGDAIGHTVKIAIDTVEGPWQIVGIARDTKSGNPRKSSDRMVYIPIDQIRGKQGEGIEDGMASTILVRVQGNPQDAVATLRRAVAAVDPNLPLLKVRTIQQHLGNFVSHESLISRLTAIFALLALLLASIGLYGVMSYSVTRRTGEIGIRIALGASPHAVQRMVLRESILLLAIGILLGVPLALAGGRYVRAQLFELSPYDPAIFATAIASIALVTVFAAWLPARRASRINPMAALRCE
jgi:predicted permease